MAVKAKKKGPSGPSDQAAPRLEGENALRYHLAHPE